MHDSIRELLRGPLRRIADIAVPVVVALYLSALVGAASTDLPQWMIVLARLAGLAQGVALFWRRSHPVLVMVIALVGGLVTQLVAPDGIFPIAGLIAIASLAVSRPPRVSLPALAALLALTALNFFTAPTGDALFAMAFPVVIWALGEAVRSRRMAIEQATRRAAGDEQARIARELHDVIAHSVSVMVVQAAAADDVFDEHPDKARAALRAIESAGRDALGELRRLLAGVRPGDGAPAQDVQPEPGLARLNDLVESMGTAGLAVSVRRDGLADTALPAGIELTAYRIIQEALTNTLRHASARHARVTLCAAAGVLEVDVSDDGRAHSTSNANGQGRGITGMRDRAAMLGGTLEAGPDPGGGFRVHARLPLEPSR